MSGVILQTPTVFQRPCPGYCLLDFDSIPDKVCTSSLPPYVTASVSTLRHVECNLVICSPCGGDATACDLCTNLKFDTAVSKTLARAKQPVSDMNNVNDAYLSNSQLREKLKLARDKLNTAWLEGMNTHRKSAHAMKALSNYKRLVQAFATEDVPRVRQLLTYCLKQGKSPQAMLAMVQDVAKGIHHVKQFSAVDFDISTLILRIGGPQLLHACGKALGLPSVSLTRHKHSHRSFLVADVFSQETLRHNAESLQDTFQQMEGDFSTLMIDEIAVERCVRFQRITNGTVGRCGDHGQSNEKLVSFQQLLEDKAAVDVGSRHIAHEASVVAFGAIRAQAYLAVPLLALPTCKSKTTIRGSQADYQLLVLNACLAFATDQLRLSVLAVSSDADPSRVVCLTKLCSVQDIPTAWPSFSILSQLRLLCLRCARMGATVCFDHKHVVKRSREVWKSPTRGFVVFETKFTGTTLQFLAVAVNVSFPDTLLRPQDAQNVPDAVALLRAIIQTAAAPQPDSVSPGARRQLRELRLVAFIADCLLAPILHAHWSLTKQLSRQSALGHMVCFLHAQHGTKFMPNQLYHSVQCNVKNIFFSVARFQTEKPDKAVFLFMLGDDRLEQNFANIRTQSHDRNVDCSQLGDRIMSAMDVAEIQSRRPDWKARSKRLDMKECDDHTNPESWMHASPTPRANTSTRNIHIPSSWSAGRRKCIDRLG